MKIKFLLAITSSALATFLTTSDLLADDSTAYSSAVPTSNGMYWDCYQTIVKADPWNTSTLPQEFWFYDADGGGWGNRSHNVYCWTQAMNPWNSIPVGINIWRDPGSGPNPGTGRYYYQCGHLEPVCVWRQGPPPKTGLNFPITKASLPPP